MWAFFFNVLQKYSSTKKLPGMDNKKFRTVCLILTLIFLIVFLLLGILYAEGSVSPSLYNDELNVIGLHYKKWWMLLVALIFSFCLQFTIQWRRVQGWDKYTNAYVQINNYDKVKPRVDKIKEAIQYDMYNIFLFIVSLLFLISQNIWIILALFFGAWLGESFAFVKQIEESTEKKKMEGEDKAALFMGRVQANMQDYQALLDPGPDGKVDLVAYVRRLVEAMEENLPLLERREEAAGKAPTVRPTSRMFSIGQKIIF